MLYTVDRGDDVEDVDAIVVPAGAVGGPAALALLRGSPVITQARGDLIIPFNYSYCFR